MFLGLSETCIYLLIREGLPMASFQEAHDWRKFGKCHKQPVEFDPLHFSGLSKILRKHDRKVLRLGREMRAAFGPIPIDEGPKNATRKSRCGELARKITASVNAIEEEFRRLLNICRLLPQTALLKLLLPHPLHAHPLTLCRPSATTQLSTRSPALHLRATVLKCS